MFSDIYTPEIIMISCKNEKNQSCSKMFSFATLLFISIGYSNTLVNYFYSILYTATIGFC